MKLNYVHLSSVVSTNSYLAAVADSSPEGTVVYADSQTAGRGQRGNSWESADGKNITMSMLLRPCLIAPNEQFCLSEVVALAVARVVERYVQDVTVKWPNDIYVGDKKICGILIEHKLSGGKISHTIAGIGLNVNQRQFFSDAPNPVSLRQLTGNDIPLDAVLHDLADEIAGLYALLPEGREGLHEEYLSRLYRAGGIYSYRAETDVMSVDGRRVLSADTVFEARIADVAPDGMLSLSTSDGIVFRFAFKEVAFLVGK